MLIRTEIAIDAPGINSLLLDSFETEHEAHLVNHLREDGQLTLGVVATGDEGEILGYAAFSPVTINNEDKYWVLLAPVAVAARVRGQGIAQRLINEGLNTLNEFGYGAVIVPGETGWFTKFGFEPVTGPYAHCQWKGKETPLYLQKLADNTVEYINGEIKFSSYFNYAD